MKWPGVALIVAVIATTGCSRSDGPIRYHMAGSVTLDGQPIPYGEVLFTPDRMKQASGPQGIAPIHDGRYDTAAAGGKGIAGGPTVIRVNGMTGPGGKTLCEYEMPVDLPRTDGTYDVTVPKNGAKKDPRNSTEI